jgi:serine/threonine-protein kinase
VRTLGRRYRLEQELGTGGMAVVWRAHDEVLGRQVAVKLLGPSFSDRVARQRIKAEAQVAARLAHPNVAGVYDFGESRQGRRRKVPYIVMELVHGDTLAVRQQSDPMHWRTAVGIAAEVAAALAAAHACGVVHRDIKPGNIMLARTGVKVVDFGIAAAVGALEDRGEELLGTPAYVAPERFAGRPAAPATDVYALGVLLYESLAGRLPWSAYSVTGLVTAHRELPPSPLPPIPGLPADVVELCEQCLSKDPDARPSSLYAAVVLAEAAGLAVTLPVVAVDPTDTGTGPADGEVAGAGGAGGAGAGSAGSAGGLSGGRGVDVETGGITRPVRPRLVGRPRLPGQPGRRRVRSHAAAEGRRRASDRAAGHAGLLSGYAAGLLSGYAAGRVRVGGFGVRRGVVGLALAGFVGVTGLVVATAANLVVADRAEGPSGEAAAPSGGCAARYVANAGAGGAFTAEVAITNTGVARLDRWALEFALPAGQRITDARGVRWDQDGQAVTLHGAEPLDAGDTQRLSLTGTAPAPPESPTGFTLDGAPCTPAGGSAPPR